MSLFDEDEMECEYCGHIIDEYLETFHIVDDEFYK